MGWPNHRMQFTFYIQGVLVEVPYHSILDILKQVVIEGQVREHKWTANWLTNRKHRVLIDWFNSEWASGVLILVESPRVWFLAQCCLMFVLTMLTLNSNFYQAVNVQLTQLFITLFGLVEKWGNLGKVNLVTWMSSHCPCIKVIGCHHHRLKD